jgi:hypothetical protein
MRRNGVRWKQGGEWSRETGTTGQRIICDEVRDGRGVPLGATVLDGRRWLAKGSVRSKRWKKSKFEGPAQPKPTLIPLPYPPPSQGGPQ